MNNPYIHSNYSSFSDGNEDEEVDDLEQIKEMMRQIEADKGAGKPSSNETTALVPANMPQSSSDLACAPSLQNPPPLQDFSEVPSASFRQPHSIGETPVEQSFQVQLSDNNNRPHIELALPQFAPSNESTGTDNFTRSLPESVSQNVQSQVHQNHQRYNQYSANHKSALTTFSDEPDSSKQQHEPDMSKMIDKYRAQLQKPPPPTTWTPTIPQEELSNPTLASISKPNNQRAHSTFARSNSHASQYNCPPTTTVRASTSTPNNHHPRVSSTYFGGSATEIGHDKSRPSYRHNSQYSKRYNHPNPDRDRGRDRREFSSSRQNSLRYDADSWDDSPMDTNEDISPPTLSAGFTRPMSPPLDTHSIYDVTRTRNAADSRINPTAPPATLPPMSSSSSFTSTFASTSNSSAPTGNNTQHVIRPAPKETPRVSDVLSKIPRIPKIGANAPNRPGASSVNNTESHIDFDSLSEDELLKRRRELTELLSKLESTFARLETERSNMEREARGSNPAKNVRYRSCEEKMRTTNVDIKKTKIRLDGVWDALERKSNPNHNNFDHPNCETQVTKKARLESPSVSSSIQDKSSSNVTELNTETCDSDAQLGKEKDREALPRNENRKVTAKRNHLLPNPVIPVPPNKSKPSLQLTKNKITIEQLREQNQAKKKLISEYKISKISSNNKSEKIHPQYTKTLDKNVDKDSDKERTEKIQDQNEKQLFKEKDSPFPGLELRVHGNVHVRILKSEKLYKKPVLILPKLNVSDYKHLLTDQHSLARLKTQGSLFNSLVKKEPFDWTLATSSYFDDSGNQIPITLDSDGEPDDLINKPVQARIKREKPASTPKSSGSSKIIVPPLEIPKVKEVASIIKGKLFSDDSDSDNESSHTKSIKEMTTGSFGNVAAIIQPSQLASDANDKNDDEDVEMEEDDEQDYDSALTNDNTDSAANSDAGVKDSTDDVADDAASNDSLDETLKRVHSSISSAPHDHMLPVIIPSGPRAPDFTIRRPPMQPNLNGQSSVGVITTSLTPSNGLIDGCVTTSVDGSKCSVGSNSIHSVTLNSSAIHDDSNDLQTTRSHSPVHALLEPSISNQDNDEQQSAPDSLQSSVITASIHTPRTSTDDDEVGPHHHARTATESPDSLVSDALVSDDLPNFQTPNLSDLSDPLEHPFHDSVD